MTYDKNLNPLLDLLISSIPAKSALHILPMKGECTSFIKVFNNWLRNSSANSL